jgi:hypothetical protein
MQPVPRSCQWLLRLLNEMIDRVPVCFGAGAPWPQWASRSLSRQFLRGVRMAEAFLRRLLLVLALDLEHTLVDTSKAVERIKGRDRKRMRTWRPPVPRFVVLDECYTPDLNWKLADLHAATKPPGHSRPPPAPVRMAALYRRLDRLRAITEDPMRRARRLAYWLARRRPDWIFAPNRRLRLPGIYGTDVRASFDAMGYGILARSKVRPPPLGPPARWGPSVTVLDW